MHTQDMKYLTYTHLSYPIYLVSSCNNKVSQLPHETGSLWTDTIHSKTLFKDKRRYTRATSNNYSDFYEDQGQNLTFSTTLKQAASENWGIKLRNKNLCKCDTAPEQMWIYKTWLEGRMCQRQAVPSNFRLQMNKRIARPKAEWSKAAVRGVSAIKAV